MEQALRIKDRVPGTTIEILTMGPGRAAEIIREGLFRGTDGRLFTYRPEENSPEKIRWLPPTLFHAQ